MVLKVILLFEKHFTSDQTLCVFDVRHTFVSVDSDSPAADVDPSPPAHSGRSAASVHMTN